MNSQKTFQGLGVTCDLMICMVKKSDLRGCERNGQFMSLRTKARKRKTGARNRINGLDESMGRLERKLKLRRI